MRDGRTYFGLVKSSAIYGLGLVAPTVASILLVPIYTKYFLPADYGVLDVLQTSATFFGMFVGAGFGEALIYFYSKATEAAARERVIVTNLLAALVLASLAGLAAWGLSPLLARLLFHDPSLAGAVQLALSAVAVSLPAYTGLATLRARDRAGLYVAVSVTQLLLTITTTILLVVFYRMGFRGVLWSNLACTGLVGLAFTIFTLFSIRVRPEASLLLRQARFILPMTATAMALFILHSGDRFFLTQFTSRSEIGLYALAYKVGMAVSLVQTAFNYTWGVSIFQVGAGEDGPRRMARVNTYQLLTITCGALGIVVFSEPALRLLANARYLGCLPYVPWITLAYVIRAEADFLRSTLYLEGAVSMDTKLTWATAVFCLLLYAVLIPIWKLWGAVAATILAFVFLFGLNFRQVIKIRAYPIEHRRLLRIVALALPLAAVPRAIHAQSNAAQWGVAAAAFACYPLALWLSGFFTTEERRMLGSLARWAVLSKRTA